MLLFLISCPPKWASDTNCFSQPRSLNTIYGVIFWKSTIRKSRIVHLILDLFLHLVLFTDVFLQVTLKSARRTLVWRLDFNSWSRSSSTSQHYQLNKGAVQLQGHTLWLCMAHTGTAKPPSHKQVQRHQQKWWLHVCYEEWRSCCSTLSKLYLPHLN